MPPLFRNEQLPQSGFWRTYHGDFQCLLLKATRPIRLSSSLSLIGPSGVMCPSSPPIWVMSPTPPPRPAVNARPVCPPKENKHVYAFIFAIFTVWPRLGRLLMFIHVFFVFSLCFSKLFERFMWFSLAIAHFFWFFCLI